MKLHIVTIRDAVAGMYRPPAYVQSVGGYLRAVADEVNRQAQDNELFKHPEDYECFTFGTWDDDSGLFALLDAPVTLGSCKSMIRGVQ